MGRPARRIAISDEDDIQLRDLELGVDIHPKVRLRASLLRLHRAGWTVAQLAEHFDRNVQAVHNDLTRFEERGLNGLADGCAPGQPRLITTEIEQFLHEKLLEERFWNATLLCAAVAEKFHVKVGTRAMTTHLHRLGYRWKRARYSPAKTLDPNIIHEHTVSIETLKKGALDGKLTLKYLDQTGLGLMLSIGSTWFQGGAGLQFKIPTRWGSSGRINLMGCYTVAGDTTGLEIRELEGNCTGEQVIRFLDTVAQGCDPQRLTVVILDNAPFHKGAAVRDKLAQWEAQGLYLRYLPPYAPFLNLIEGVWRRLKGFLMPRRCYDSVAELQAALLVGLQLLGTKFI